MTLIILAGLGAFAIYSWKWKAPSDGSERVRATAYAQELAAACGDSCSVQSLDRLTRNLWRVRIYGYGDAGRESRCFDIDLGTFRSLSGASADFAGAPLVTCGASPSQ